MFLKDSIGFLFDMDGVIVDNHKYHFLAWKKFCEKYAIQLTEIDYKQNINGRKMEQVITYLLGEKLSTDQMTEYGNEKEHIYRELYASELKPTPGLLSFLEKSKSMGISMAIGTSAPVENVRFTLDGLNIRHYFDAILDASSVKIGKPNPDIYLKSAQSLLKDPKNCIVFEDALMGIAAGKAANCFVVGIATTHHEHELTQADLIVKDFTYLNPEQFITL